MIGKEDVDETMYYGQYDQTKRHSPPHTTMALTPDWVAEEKAKASLELERQCERDRQSKDETYARFGPKQTSPSNISEVKNAYATFPAGSTTDLSGTQSYFVAGAPSQRRRGRNRKGSVPKLDKTKQASRAQTSCIKKRPVAKKEATTKAAPSNSIRTRAQGVLKFLALDYSGRAISISGH